VVVQRDPAERRPAALAAAQPVRAVRARRGDGEAAVPGHGRQRERQGNRDHRRDQRAYGWGVPPEQGGQDESAGEGDAQGQDVDRAVHARPEPGGLGGYADHVGRAAARHRHRRDDQPDG
jgi:hypothetical protein